MSERIAVGDLVMVVRGHACVLEAFGGVPFRVTALAPQTGGGWACSRCGGSDFAAEDMLGARGMLGKMRTIPLGYLKRIPPLTESVEHGEGVTA